MTSEIIMVLKKDRKGTNVQQGQIEHDFTKPSAQLKPNKFICPKSIYSDTATTELSHTTLLSNIGIINMNLPKSHLKGDTSQRVVANHH